VAVPFSQCVANGDRVLRIESKTPPALQSFSTLSTSVWKEDARISLQSARLPIEAGGIRDIRPDGDGWRGIVLGSKEFAIIRFDAGGAFRIEDTTNLDGRRPLSAVWGQESPVFLDYDYVAVRPTLFTITPNVRHEFASQLVSQADIAIGAGGSMRLATWIERPRRDHPHLRATRVDLEGRFLDDPSIDLGAAVWAGAFVTDRTDTTPPAWNGREFLVPNGDSVSAIPTSGETRTYSGHHFSATTAAWNGAEWGIAGMRADGALMFARYDANGVFVNERVLLAPEVKAGASRVEHRSSAMVWDGREFVVVWIHDDVFPPLALFPTIAPEEHSRALYRLLLDRDGTPFGAAPYLLDDAVIEAPSIATKSGETIIVWGSGTIQGARFRAAEAFATPRRFSLGDGHAPAVSAAHDGFVMTWLSDPWNRVSTREIVSLRGETMMTIARITPNDGESFEESAIADGIVATLTKSAESEFTTRAATIPLDDIGARTAPLPPMALTATRDRNDVILRWNPDAVPTFFTIERRGAAGVFREIAIAQSGATEVRVAHIDGASYRVIAWNAAGKSQPSNVVAP
jgi:hypothetical protein